MLTDPRDRRGRLALVALLLPAMAAAAQVQQVSVDHDGDRYSIDLSVRLNTDPARAYAVFADFSNLPRLNPAVIEEQVTPEDVPDRVRLRTDIHTCVAFFCRTLRQVQQMSLHPDGHGGTLHADMIPALSDFEYGAADWSFHPCKTDARQTCMRFQADVLPKFWIPPLIGPWLIERRMREEIVITAKSIERLAREPDRAP